MVTNIAERGKYDAELLARFDGVRPTGDGQWEARCSAHEDRKASLSLSITSDGTWLIHCHAGCSTADVLDSVGLKLANLFPQSKRNGNGSSIVATYDYRNESGELLFQVCRMEPKDFRQRKPDGNGGWTWSTKGVRRVLYRLSELLKADPSQTVFIVEGEKDVDRLPSMGLVATCNSNGSGKWRRGYADCLQGRRVAIIADNDAPGMKHAKNIPRMIHRAVASVKLVELPGVNLPDGFDVSDWLGKDGMASDLLTLAEETDEWQPAPDDSPEPNKPDSDKPAKSFMFLTATEFDGLDLRREYHVPGVLAAGAVPTILAGAFKTLKTSIVMDLLISLATKNRFLNHFTVSHRVRVAVMSGESGGFALQNLARRVAQSKGWAFNKIEDWFSICTAVPNLSSSADLHAVERFIVEHEIGVLCIDPTYLAMRSLRADDAGSIFAMGELLEPLSRLGERTGCTPLIVHHNTRSSIRVNAGEPAELADIAWSGFAEWAGQWLLISRREKFDPDSEGEHRLWLTAGGRDGHSTLVGVNVTEGRSDSQQGRRWEVQVVDAGKARADAMEAAHERKAEQKAASKEKEANRDRDAIEDVMRRMGDAETKTAIREQSGIGSRRFDTAFAELIRDEVLEKSKIIKGKNHQYDAYKLHRTTSDRIGPVGCGPLQPHINGPPPLRGGGSDAAVLLPVAGSSNENKSGPVRSDANGDENGDDATEGEPAASVDAIDINELFDDSF